MAAAKMITPKSRPLAWQFSWVYLPILALMFLLWR